MEALAADFESKNVRFYYVYKSLAHPEWNNYLVPQSLDERLLHIAEAKKTLKTNIPWLCDSMDNSFAKEMGSLPNSDFIIGPDGTIVKRHAWSNTERLRSHLTELVGEVDRKIPLEALPAADPPPAAYAPTGLVKRLKKPDGLMTLKSQLLAQGDARKHDHYVKLKAEADSDCMFAGTGKLFLTFLLDPVYHVHWNNLGPPVKVQVKCDDELFAITPNSSDGTKPDAEGDADPREFEFDIDGWNPEKTLTVNFSYIGCHDEEGWCMPIEQQFEISCEAASQRGITILPEYRPRLIRSLDIRDGDKPKVAITASQDQLNELAGIWAMTTARTFSESEWELHLDVKDGALVGWSTYNGAEPAVRITKFDGQELRLWQLDGPAPEEIVLNLKGDKLRGKQLSVFGDFKVSGNKVPDVAQEVQELEKSVGSKSSLKVDDTKDQP